MTCQIPPYESPDIHPPYNQLLTLMDLPSLSWSENLMAPASLELATDSEACQSPSPSELAYDGNSDSEVAHDGVPPNFDSRPFYEYGGDQQNLENTAGVG